MAKEKTEGKKGPRAIDVPSNCRPLLTGSTFLIFGGGKQEGGSYPDAEKAFAVATEIKRKSPKSVVCIIRARQVWEVKDADSGDGIKL